MRHRKLRAPSFIPTRAAIPTEFPVKGGRRPIMRFSTSDGSQYVRDVESGQIRIIEHKPTGKAQVKQWKKRRRLLREQIQQRGHV